jgi:14-3-3 protein epsilon
MADERELLLSYLRVSSSSMSPIRIDEQSDNMTSMKRVIQLNPVLSADDRTLLHQVYKTAVSSRRLAIKDVQALIQEISGSPAFGRRHPRLLQFMNTLKQELKDICLDLITLIDESLVPASFEPEQRVFYAKMKADYLRYLAEDKEAPSFETYSAHAKVCYETAMEIAAQEYPATSPVYLGLVLNFTVFLYDIMKLHNEAIELAKRTYSATADLIDAIGDLAYNEAAGLLNLFRENYTAWIRFRDQA